VSHSCHCHSRSMGPLVDIVQIYLLTYLVASAVVVAINVVNMEMLQMTFQCQNTGNILPLVRSMTVWQVQAARNTYQRADICVHLIRRDSSNHCHTTACHQCTHHCHSDSQPCNRRLKQYGRTFTLSVRRQTYMSTKLLPVNRTDIYDLLGLLVT